MSTYDAYNETLESQKEKESEVQNLKDQMRLPQESQSTFTPDHVPSQYAGSDQTLPILLPLQFSLIVTDSRGTMSQPATVSQVTTLYAAY